MNKYPTSGMILYQKEMMNMTNRVTISLPEEMLKILDSFAQEWKTTRSGAVVEMIRKTHKTKLEEESSKGYLEWAEENLKTAEYIFATQKEAIVND